MPFQDERYTIVIEDTYDGVIIGVYSTSYIHAAMQYHHADFGRYTVSPPGKLSKMLYGSFESQIQSAVNSLMSEIEVMYYVEAKQRKKIDKTFECTKTTLKNMYGG